MTGHWRIFSYIESDKTRSNRPALTTHPFSRSPNLKSQISSQIMIIEKEYDSFSHTDLPFFFFSALSICTARDKTKIMGQLVNC